MQMTHAQIVSFHRYLEENPNICRRIIQSEKIKICLKMIIAKQRSKSQQLHFNYMHINLLNSITCAAYKRKYHNLPVYKMLLFHATVTVQNFLLLSLILQ